MHKILFHIGSTPVYSYGLMVSLGVIAAFICGIICGKDRNFKTDKTIYMILFVFLSGLAGAKILFIILHLNNFTDLHDGIFHITGSGLAWHGGVAGGILFMIYFSRTEKIPFFDVADLSVLCGILGLVFGRIGCFLNGCCYGKPSSLPWAVIFPRAGDFPRHPTQIYESSLDLVVFLILLYLWKKNRYRGEVFCGFILLYGLVRFTVEFWREHFLPLTLGLTVAQLISIGMMITGLILYWKIRRATYN